MVIITFWIDFSDDGLTSVFQSLIGIYGYYNIRQIIIDTVTTIIVSIPDRDLWLL